MNAWREESDALGRCRVPADALHGVHTERARENFDLSGRRPHEALVRAYGAVKLAAARTNRELGFRDKTTAAAIEQAAAEMLEGKLTQHIVVDALQGGAGTSTNMNVNEVLANRALQILGDRPGDYGRVDPIRDINRHQSTNDTYPTALRVAAIWLLRDLEQALVHLQESFQKQERATAGVVRLGRTQLQEAVLTTMGRQMSAYADAIARDRWRVYKCEERLRVVNLGGTAIGTGLGAPKPYIFKVVEVLKAVSGIGLSRAENLVEATQNADVFVEVSGILSACAATLMKISGDLRLLSSGPDAGLGELQLPPRQAGSSIMPGKVNPVIPEAVTQVSLVVTANHGLIAQACGMGSLELNPFLPVVADRLLESLDLLTSGCDVLSRYCVDGITAEAGRCSRHVDGATATLTALSAEIGYAEAERLAVEMRETGETVREIVTRKQIMSAEACEQCLSPEAVMKLGSDKPAARK